MHLELKVVRSPQGFIYRISRIRTDPFSSPPWNVAGEDGTFGNRFDDPGARKGMPPDQRFRMIYCASLQEAAFGETLARFRPSLSLLAALEEIDDDESLSESLGGAVNPADVRRGLIPDGWLASRQIGTALLDPDLTFVDIGAAESIQTLRTELARYALNLPNEEVDLSALVSQHRDFTQWCSRFVYECSDGHGAPVFAGIRYLSRLGADWECWAIFADRVRYQLGWPAPPQPIRPDNPALIRVANLFGLDFPTEEAP